MSSVTPITFGFISSSSTCSANFTCGCKWLRFQRLRLVGQLGFLDGDNADIVAVEESQQFSDFSADSVRVPLHLFLDS